MPRPMPKPARGATTRPASIAALCFSRAETAVVARKSGTAAAMRRATTASGGGELVQRLVQAPGENHEIGDRIRVGAQPDGEAAAVRVCADAQCVVRGDFGQGVQTLDPTLAEVEVAGRAADVGDRKREYVGIGSQLVREPEKALGH